MDLSFVTIGDDAFFDSIEISVQQAHRFYPDASFYIYDWGFTDTQRASLRAESNVEEIVSWTDWEEVDAINRRASLQHLKRHLYRFLPISYASSGEIEKNREREQNYAQKPFCLLDCLKRCRSRLIYLDGDAFLVNRIDALLDEDFDVGVTLRRPEEIVNKQNQCQVLNAGVLVFNGPPTRTEAFLRQWIRRMESTYEYLVEQTALTRLIEDGCPGVFDQYYNREQLALPEREVTVNVLPCERYNFNWIEEGVDPDTTSIVHFKGGRHDEGQFRKLLREIEGHLPSPGDPRS